MLYDSILFCMAGMAMMSNAQPTRIGATFQLEIEPGGPYLQAFTQPNPLVGGYVIEFAETIDDATDFYVNSTTSQLGINISPGVYVLAQQLEHSEEYEQVNFFPTTSAPGEYYYPVTVSLSPDGNVAFYVANGDANVTQNCGGQLYLYPEFLAAESGCVNVRVCQV